MAAPIISDLLILAVTRSTHKCSAGVSVVLPENLCGFGPDAQMRAGKGITRHRNGASSANRCRSCCVGAEFALFAILQASWCFGPETVAQQI
ncbi:hypothetical protein [Microcoleus sp.]|uniref:hypothetical protein n=1 Tax=Microcoleus sp. TaxID=44472 RepID=UPI00403E810E